LVASTSLPAFDLAGGGTVRSGLMIAWFRLPLRPRSVEYHPV